MKHNFEIIKNKVVLHFDEHPILFIGFNNKNQIVIGSFLYEDEDESLLFFYSIVNNVLAAAFLKGKVSYYHVLKLATNIYIVRTNYSNDILSFESVNFKDIDPDFLPHKNAYSPNVDDEIISSFGNNYWVFQTQKYSIHEAVDTQPIWYTAHVRNNMMSTNKPYHNVYKNTYGVVQMNPEKSRNKAKKILHHV